MGYTTSSLYDEDLYTNDFFVQIAKNYSCFPQSVYMTSLSLLLSCHKFVVSFNKIEFHSI